MAIRVRRIDTGAINTQAFNNLIGTITQLKGQQRDREITTGLAKIERTSQIALDLAANDPILSDDEKLVEIQKIRQAARISKLDMLTQTGDFSPPQSRGIGGFLGRLAGAFDPTDTRGVTQSPMTQAIQGRLVQQDFPTVSEQARADATRIASRRRVTTADKATAKALRDRSPAILKEIGELQEKLLVSFDEEVNKFREERISELLKEYRELNPGAPEPGQIPDAVTRADAPTAPLVSTPQFVPTPKKSTKAERDRLQGVFELMTDEQKVEAQEKLKQGKTPEEIVSGFLAALASKSAKEMTVEELRFERERLQ